MTARRRRLATSLAAWLAMATLLATSLLPGWAHALGHRNVHRVAGWTEICSAQGSRWVRVADPTADTPAHDVVAWLEHCPDCLPELDLPPQPPTQALPRTSTPTPARLSVGAPAPLRATDPAGRRPPPRGPPARA